MRLVDLDPRWFAEAGRDGQGVTFLCPHCMTTRLAVAFANPTDGGPPIGDWSSPAIIKLVAALWTPPLVGTDIVPPGFRWQRDGETFVALSLSPSVDASNSGHWHGFIRSGEIQ